MSFSIRRFSSSSLRLIKERTNSIDVGKFKAKTTFDKNFPKKPLKAWERENVDKDTFFKKKYAHIHAKQLNSPTAELNKRKQLEKKLEYLQKTKDSNSSPSDDREKAFYKRRRHENKTFVNSFQNPLTEFIYGTSAVLAALKANKRMSYLKLCLLGSNPKDGQLMALAKSKGIYIDTSLDRHKMNILSNNNPHNGVILEARPIVLGDIKHCGPAVITENLVNVERELNHLDEDFFEIEFLDQFGNSDVDRITFRSDKKKANANPLGLFIDEVTDPHNLGAIIRSAYFLGADFIVITLKNSAPLNSVVAKASSGALELLNIYSVSKPLKFIEQSKNNGWRFVSSALVSPNSSYKDKIVQFGALNKMLQETPCILIVGSEGHGIRKNILNMSDAIVQLDSARGGFDSVVDSLNVSVATALFINKFLQ